MIDKFLYGNRNYEIVEDNLKIKQQSVNWKRVWKKSYDNKTAELYLQRDANDRVTGAARLGYYKDKETMKYLYFIKK